MEYQLILIDGIQPIILDEGAIPFSTHGHFYSFESNACLHRLYAHPSVTSRRIIAGVSGLPNVDLSRLSDDEKVGIGFIDVNELAYQYFREKKHRTASDAVHWANGFKKSVELLSKKFTYDDMMDIAGFCAAMDNTRPIAHLKEEAKEYIRTRKLRNKAYRVEIELTYDQTEKVYQPSTRSGSIVVNKIIQHGQHG